MLLNAIYSKIFSESLLSLYPVFVKKIDISLLMQLWTRLITYVLISLFFINYAFVSNSLLTQEGMILSLVNLFHIYCSYEGFNNLDSGVSFSIFNIYPLLILLFSGTLWKPAYFVAIIGLLFFIYDNYIQKKNNNNENFNYGIIMIIFAAISEAIIFFLIREIKTDNNWNHLFISYFWGAIISSIYLFFVKDNQQNKVSNSNTWFYICIAIIINGIIGTIGYYLRFYSIYRLNTETYALLSYFGIIMAYFYGIIINNEQINIYKIIGTLLILILINYLIKLYQTYYFI
jgi:drug/metabolite transporter (DMT)-like permease